MPSTGRHRMAPQGHARRLPLIFSALLAALPAPALADDPSPRRQAELDEVVARRRADRQKRARMASGRAAAYAQLAREVREYEVAMARNLALFQMAAASRESLAARSWWGSRCRPRQDDFGPYDRAPATPCYQSPAVVMPPQWTPPAVSLPSPSYQSQPTTTPPVGNTHFGMLIR